MSVTSEKSKRTFNMPANTRATKSSIYQARLHFGQVIKLNGTCASVTPLLGDTVLAATVGLCLLLGSGQAAANCTITTNVLTCTGTDNSNIITATTGNKYGILFSASTATRLNDVGGTRHRLGWGTNPNLDTIIVDSGAVVGASYTGGGRAFTAGIYNFTRFAGVNLVNITNHGTIRSSSNSSGSAVSAIASTRLQATPFTLTNNGLIEAISSGDVNSYAINVGASGGINIINNASGRITTNGTGRAISLSASTQNNSLVNAGLVEDTIFMGKGNDTIINTGTITAPQIRMNDGNDSINNAGTIEGEIFFNPTTAGMISTVVNSGTIRNNGSMRGDDALIFTGTDTVSALTNTGVITTEGNTYNSTTYGIGALAYAYQNVSSTLSYTVDNSGTIRGESLAMHARSKNGGTIINSGDISSVNASAISYTGALTLDNNGTITAGNNTAYDATFGAGAAITEARWALEGSDDSVNNQASGVITGDITLYDGDDIVSNLGSIVGDTVLGLGDDVFNLKGGSNTGDIYGDNVTAVAADGNDTFNWSGGELNSGFFGGNGSDTATISGASVYDGTETFDGGDDVAVADDWTDTLTIQGKTATVATGTMINWENITLDNSSLSFADAMLTVGSDAGTGLTLSNGTTLSAFSGFNLTGNLTNNAIITMQDGNTGDVLAVSGDYVSTGQLLIDTNFAAGTSDMLTIAGNVTGSGTQIQIQDISSGPSTGNVFSIVTVAGTTAASDFTLAAPIISGAFNYNSLALDGQSWVLQSAAADGGASYIPLASSIEGFGRSLLVLETLPTLDQRQSLRNDRFKTNDNTRFASEHIWLRTEGGERNINNGDSTTRANFETDYWKIQMGADIYRSDNQQGRFVVGVNGNYAESDTNTNATAGKGDIDTEGYSLGLTTTWHAHTDGLYVNGQLQASRYRSDMSGGAIKGSPQGQGADSIENIESHGYSASLEVGKRIQLEPAKRHKLNLTPQAQLTYSKVKFDQFTGKNNLTVDAGDAKSLQARLGLKLDGQLNNQENHSTQGYVIANVIHEFDNDNQAQINGANLELEVDRWKAELGGGASHVWNGKGKTSYELYGELTANTSLEDIGESNGLKGTLGFSVKF